MPVQSREQLKNYFRNGTLAREEYFQDLIDSTVNKVNDNIMPDGQQGLGLMASLKGNRFLSFFKNLGRQRDDAPSLFIELVEGSNGTDDGISLSAPGYGDETKSLLYLRPDASKPGAPGRIGVNTTVPFFALDVNGTVGMTGRAGRYVDPAVNPKQVFANGKWHKLITNLKGFHAFEIIAAAYSPDGAYAMQYAVAMNVFGRNKQVSPLQQVYNRRKNRIQMQWTRQVNGAYSLEIRTRSDYKSQRLIYTRITKLWN